MKCGQALDCVVDLPSRNYFGCLAMLPRQAAADLLVRWSKHMSRDPKYVFAQKYHEAAREIRGRYVNSVAVLETEMARFITGYFCVDDYRRDLFFSEVATGQAMMLNAKIKLLTKILKRDYQGYLENHPDLLKQFDSVRDYRNQLAHATLDVSDEQLTKPEVDGIGFVYYKDGQRQVHFVSLADAEEKQVEINMLLGNLNELQSLLPYRYPRKQIDEAI